MMKLYPEATKIPLNERAKVKGQRKTVSLSCAFMTALQPCLD
jgi:hypothetical protein